VSASASPSPLRRLARRTTEAREAALAPCELCGAPLAPDHRHLMDLERRTLLCACRACAVVMASDAAGGGHYRLVPDRLLALAGFDLPDPLWEELRVPVDIAFFFHDTAAGRVVAFYPSPMGATESQLELASWEAIARANPVLETMAPDAEALLVDRARGDRRHWIVPVDECYRLVGLIRGHWRGLTGGTEVWKEITAFFDGLDARARAVDRWGERTTTSAAHAAEGS
jgi:Family of unknown function (DUF5947)